MGKVKDYAIEVADELIDSAVNKIQKGKSMYDAVEELLQDPAVTAFYDKAELDLIIDFELEHVTKNKTIQ
tara:strand:+ start:144 stop:353 length:210 start_codon:yes stop_codon:yes gene_type:complete